jgi:hypothetical protein
VVRKAPKNANDNCFHGSRVPPRDRTLDLKRGLVDQGFRQRVTTIYGLSCTIRNKLRIIRICIDSPQLACHKIIRMFGCMLLWILARFERKELMEARSRKEVKKREK